MNWKIPDFFQQTWSKLSTVGQSQTSEDANCSRQGATAQCSDFDEEIPKPKRCVPYRRVESAVHTFVQVAVPADLERLYRHRKNIKRWKKMNDYPKLRAEYINSGRTVQQLTRNLHEMELLRTKVLEEDLPQFDSQLNPAKEQAMNAIEGFLEIHGEVLSDDGKITQTSDKAAPPTDTDSENPSEVTGSAAAADCIPVEEFKPSDYGDCKDTDPPSPNPNPFESPPAPKAGVARMRGNQLVIEPVNSQDEHANEGDERGPSDVDPPQHTPFLLEPCDNDQNIGESSRIEEDDDETELQPGDQPSTSLAEICENCENEVAEVISTQQQQQQQVEVTEGETEEWWEKLRKDLTQLHTTICDFSSIVHQQGEVVDDIASNIEEAEENISEGTSHLKKATVLKAAMFPVLGAVVGGIVGGPIGFAAGLKLGSVTSGLAAAGVTGSMIGYQGGKMLKEKQENSIEMKPMNQDNEEDSTSSGSAAPASDVGQESHTEADDNCADTPQQQ